MLSPSLNEIKGAFSTISGIAVNKSRIEEYLDTVRVYWSNVASKGYRPERFKTRVEVEHIKDNPMFEFAKFCTMCGYVIKAIQYPTECQSSVNVLGVIKSKLSPTDIPDQNVVDYIGTYVLWFLYDHGWIDSTYENGVITRK